jgi:hypothetical protein
MGADIVSQLVWIFIEEDRTTGEVDRSPQPRSNIEQTKA